MADAGAGHDRHGGRPRDPADAGATGTAWQLVEGVWKRADRGAAGRLAVPVAAGGGPPAGAASADGGPEGQGDAAAALCSAGAARHRGRQ
eukprot:1955397-Pyramimonas_sp.AAC.1